jgi:3-hydroxybutyryl-CoA dehydratase
MRTPAGLLRFEIGSELRSSPRAMTRERMRWYVDAQPTVAADDGRIHTQPPTIHDDDDYARSQGLPGIIADGMISTNWIMGLLLDTFGRDFVERGKLRTRYIRPIYEDEVITSRARVVSIARTEAGRVTYVLEVWSETADGTKATVGEAVVHAEER